MSDRLNTAELEAIRERKSSPGAMKSACGEYECPCHDLVPRLLATIEHLAAVIHEACEAPEFGPRHKVAMAALFQAEEEYHVPVPKGPAK